MKKKWCILISCILWFSFVWKYLSGWCQDNVKKIYFLLDAQSLLFSFRKALHKYVLIELKDNASTWRNCSGKILQAVHEWQLVVVQGSTHLYDKLFQKHKKLFPLHSHVIILNEWLFKVCFGKIGTNHNLASKTLREIKNIYFCFIY